MSQSGGEIDIDVAVVVVAPAVPAAPLAGKRENGASTSLSTADQAQLQERQSVAPTVDTSCIREAQPAEEVVFFFGLVA
jgi:hypothetical protein